MNIITEFGESITLDAYAESRLRADQSITFLSFIDELRRLWMLCGKTATIIRHQPMQEDLKLPLITFRLIRRLINQQFKDIKPRHRMVIRHPDDENEFIELKGQIFDFWVEFLIHAPTSEEADRLVDEFDDFLLMYRGFFKQMGVQELLFYAQGEDHVMADYKFPIACRPLQYTVRFEKITPIFLNQIERLAVQANVKND